MKRCPECSRDYFDDTLLYCLDDGTALLDGPASFEPRTEIIPGESQRGEKIHTAETRVYASNPSSNLPSNSRTLFIAAALGGVLLLAAAGYGVYRFTSGVAGPAVPQRSSANMQVQRLTGDGKTRGAVISPDGKLLAYIRTEGGERSVWIKQIATDSALQLARPGELDRFEAITFSPDGVFLYFNAEPARDEPPSVYRVSTLGGTPTKVIENALGIKFSQDGKLVSYGRFDIPTNEASFFVANPDGSGERKIASRRGTPFFNPHHAWSPDGKLIAAVGGDDTLPPAPGMSIVLIQVAGGVEPVEMAGRRWGTLSEIVWHPSGDSILIAAAETTATQSQIWEVAYPSGEVRRLTNNLNGHNAVSVTADGKAIVTGEIYSRTALWVSPDLKPENAKQIMPASADTWGFGWTPDNRIVMSSDRSGDPEIWIIDADGANARALTNDRVFKQTPVVSPDGRFIVYSSAAGGGTLERIDINGGNRIQLTDGKIGADNADISSDGKWVLFSGWTSGASRIMKVPLSGGEPQIVTEYQAMEPRYSRDGTRFACFMPNETTRVWTRLAIVPAEGGPPITVFDAPPNTSLARGPVWTPDDSGIVVIVAEGEKLNLWLLPVDGSPGKQMTDFDVPGIARRDYSRDGKRIAMMRSEGIGTAIMITDFR